MRTYSSSSMDNSTGNPFEVANMSPSHELRDQLVANERKILLQVGLNIIHTLHLNFLFSDWFFMNTRSALKVCHALYVLRSDCARCFCCVIARVIVTLTDPFFHWVKVPQETYTTRFLWLATYILYISVLLWPLVVLAVMVHWGYLKVTTLCSSSCWEKLQHTCGPRGTT